MSRDAQNDSAGARAIARNTALLTAAQAVGTLARLAYVVLVARLLGPELYALLAWVQSWHLAFLPLALAGLGPAVVHWIGYDRGRARDFAATGLALRLAATALAAAACLALVTDFAPDARAPALVALLLLALAGRALAAWGQHLYIAHDLNRHTLRQEAAFRVLELAAAIAVLLAGAGLAALVAVHAFAWSAQAAIALRVAGRAGLPVRPAWSPPAARDLARFALPFLALQVLAEWRIHGPFILYRGVAGDAAGFAQFALAMQAMLIATALPQALGAAAQPALARSAARGDGRDLAYAATLQRFAFLGGTAAGLAGLALGPPLFSLLFGAAYAEAGRLAGLALWCLVPVAAGFGLPLVFVARGEPGGQVAQSLVATLVTATLVPLLGARLGAAGAILGAGLGFATPPLVSTVVAAGRGWIDWRAVLARPALATGAALAAYLVLERVSPFAALAAALATLAAAALALGVASRADAALLGGLLGRHAASPPPLP